MADFYIKQGDTAPAIESQLQDDAGNIISLSGASVDFHMQHKHGDESDVVSSSASVTTPASGLVQYNWQSGDTDTPGEFVAEWEVTYSDGSVESFPNHRDLEIEITREIS